MSPARPGLFTVNSPCRPDSTCMYPFRLTPTLSAGLALACLLPSPGVHQVLSAPADHLAVRTDLDSLRSLARFLPGGGSFADAELKDIGQGLAQLGREGREFEGETLAFLPGHGLIWGTPPAGPTLPSEESRDAPPAISDETTEVGSDSPDEAPEGPWVEDLIPGCPAGSVRMLSLDVRIDGQRQHRIEQGLKGHVSPGLVGRLVRFQAQVCTGQAWLSASFDDEGAAHAAENVCEGLRDLISAQLRIWGPQLARLLDRTKLFEPGTRDRIRKVIDNPDAHSWLDRLDPTVHGRGLVLTIEP